MNACPTICMALCASWRPGTELFVSPDSLTIAELFALGTVLLAQEATCLNVLIGGDAVTSSRSKRRLQHTHGLKHKVSERIWIIGEGWQMETTVHSSCGAKLPLQSSDSPLQLLLHSCIFQHHITSSHFSQWPTDSRMTHLSG